MEFFNENHQYLKVRSDRLGEYVSYINKNRITNIAINSHWGYQRKEVDFLNECLGIQRIFIVDNDIELSGIVNLKHLKCLISSSSPSFKLSLPEFELIEELRIDSHKNWQNWEDCMSLVKIQLHNYKGVGLDPFNKLPQLNELTLVGGTIHSLSGMEKMKNLIYFKGANLKKLVNIGLGRKQKSMRTLKLENCKKLTEVESISNLEELRTLFLTNCKEIPSITFVRLLPNLDDLRISFTKVIDGNLLPLKGIKKVHFTNYPHYNIKYEDLMQDGLG